MYQVINFLKTSKFEFLLSLIGVILFQLVRFSYIPFYIFLLFVTVLILYHCRLRLKIETFEFIPLFFYCVMILLSVLFFDNAIDKTKAILGILNAFIIPALFYVLFTLSDDSILCSVKKIWIFVFVTALIVCLFEYLYYLLFKSYKERTISIFFNPNIFAFFLVMIYPFVLSFLKSDRLRIVASGAVFLGILLSGSRAGLLVYLFEAVLINARLVRRNMGKLLMGLSLILFLFLPKIIYRIPKVSDVYNAKSAVGQRVFAIEFVLNYFKHRNVFEGIGTAQFESLFKSLKPPGIVLLHSAHNLFLNVLIEYGIIGYMMYVFLVYFIVFISTFNILRSKESFDWLLGVGIISITIFQMFDMAEITNLRMMVVNLIYVYYMVLILRRFRRWRHRNEETFLS